jgi:hypothetical protein
MRGLTGALDNHESYRRLLAAENATGIWDPQTEFRSIEGSIIGEGVETGATKVVREGIEESMEQSLIQLMKQGVRSTPRAFYKVLKESPVFRGTVKYTVIGSAAIGVASFGIWIFSIATKSAFGSVGGTVATAEDFAARQPFAAAGLGLGLVLVVGAVTVALVTKMKKKKSGDGVHG